MSGDKVCGKQVAQYTGKPPDEGSVVTSRDSTAPENEEHSVVTSRDSVSVSVLGAGHGE